MEKYLKITEDFGVFSEGDIFERNENGDYVYEDSFENGDLDDNKISMKQHTKIVLSKNLAKKFIQHSVLEEVKNNNTSFVNVFDEINKLREIYVKDLANIDDDMKNAPMCLQVEKNTVLSNMIKVLDHLYSLKK